MSSPEDMLSDMFGEFAGLNKAQATSKILFTLVRNAQINMLKQLRIELDKNIDKLTREGAASMAYDEDLDPFKILGVEKTATKDDIKRAFRAKAAEAHPDRGGSHEQMIKVNAAYEAIKQFRGWK